MRGIEWSLQAFVSMPAVCLFLRARAVVKFFLRATSTLENTGGEQRALRVLRKFSAGRNLSFINRIRCFASSNS